LGDLIDRHKPLPLAVVFDSEEKGNCMDEGNGLKSVRPISEGMFVMPSPTSEQAYLVGSKCRSCGKISFPSRIVCRKCASQDLESVPLSRTGTLYSFTSLDRRPPGYFGEVPYIFGVVELPEGERICTHFTDCDIESLRIGMDMELVLGIVGKDPEGNELLGWKFRPLRSK